MREIYNGKVIEFCEDKTEFRLTYKPDFKTKNRYNFGGYNPTIKLFKTDIDPENFTTLRHAFNKEVSIICQGEQDYRNNLPLYSVSVDRETVFQANCDQS